MIVAVNTGRKGSKGFPSKNNYKVLGKPLAYYSTKSALDTPEIDKVYMSTDDTKLMDMSKKLGAEVIERPYDLCTDKAKSGDVFLHALYTISKRIKPKKVDLIVLLMANAFCVTPEKLSEGINFLRKNSSYDSAVTVSKYNMWNPIRARRIVEETLQPYDPFVFTIEDATSDRNDQTDCWFADMGASIVRPKCLRNIGAGMLPQQWMGQKIYPLKQEGGFDVDYEWQVPMAEYWLKKYGGYK
jgi:hypothetical protein